MAVIESDHHSIRRASREEGGCFQVRLYDDPDWIFRLRTIASYARPFGHVFPFHNHLRRFPATEFRIHDNHSETSRANKRIDDERRDVVVLIDASAGEIFVVKIAALNTAGRSENEEARQMTECGIQPIGNEPQDGTSSASSFQWLPDPSSSTLKQAGAPTGTPFLGATAEIEKSINEGGWNWRDMPGNSNDEKWFHFVHRTPLSGYENHPFFTTNNYVKTDATDRFVHPESLHDYQNQLPPHPNGNDERGQPDNP